MNVRILGSLAIALSVLASPATAAPTTFSVSVSDLDDPLVATSRVVVERAYQIAGQPVKFVELPLRRAFAMLLDGSLPANLHRTADAIDEHPELVRVPTAVNQAEVRIYVRGDVGPIGQWSDLKPYRVCHHRGAIVLERGLRDHGMRVESNSPADSLRMLTGGQCDVMVAVEPQGAPPSTEAGLRRIDTVLQHIAMFHVVGASYGDLGKRLDKALQQMEQTGESAQLRRAAFQRLAAAAKDPRPKAKPAI
jgi:ABC-type amino acid transport substrate-binding protein